MGAGESSVQFFARGVTQSRPPQRMGAEKQHVKMWVTDGAVTHEVCLVERGQGAAAGRKIRSRFRAAGE